MDLFFFGKYTNTPSADQSTSLSALTNNDFQVLYGVPDNTASKLNIPYSKHMNGLVVIKLGTRSITTTRVYDNNSKSVLKNVGSSTITLSTNLTCSNSPKPRLIGTNYYVISSPSATNATYSGVGPQKYCNWSTTAKFSRNYANVVSPSSTLGYMYYGRCYNYTGSYWTFTASESGSYKIECWGAGGSDDPAQLGAIPGRGGYVSGNIHLDKNNQLYIYVGGQGDDSDGKNSLYNSGGWNGGGYGTGNNSNDPAAGGGGGSTDIRIVKHTESNGWGGTESLRSRIMVAGGGGGCLYFLTGVANGGNAGGLVGDPTPIHKGFEGTTDEGTGGTQTSGGNYANSLHNINEYYTLISSGEIGVQGYFGYANQTKPTSYAFRSGGCGSGWYGGSNGHGRGGSGGSSFISGMTGCVAITADGKQTSGVSTMTINGKTYTFTSPVMKGGGESMPKHDGTSGTMTGNYGNGYAIITQLSY